MDVLGDRFKKLKTLIKGSGMPVKLSPGYVHTYDKAPDETLVKPADLKMNKKVVKL